MFDKLKTNFGTVLVVVDQPASIGALPPAVARDTGCKVAYLPGLGGHPDLGERVGKERIAVRELMVHRIEEYARHCGHADLLRECVD